MPDQARPVVRQFETARSLKVRGDKTGEPYSLLAIEPAFLVDRGYIRARPENAAAIRERIANVDEGAATNGRGQTLRGWIKAQFGLKTSSTYARLRRETFSYFSPDAGRPTKKRVQVAMKTGQKPLEQLRPNHMSTPNEPRLRSAFFRFWNYPLSQIRRGSRG